MDEAVAPRMAGLGFRRRGRVYSPDLGEEWAGAIRLSVSKAADGSLRVARLVSVVHLPSSRWFEEHLGHPAGSTFVLHAADDGVGRLDRFGGQTVLLDDEDAVRFAGALADAARDVILPWMQRSASTDSLLDPAARPMGGGYGERVEQAVAAGTCGRPDLAVRYLDETIAAVDDAYPEVAERIRRTVQMVAASFGLSIRIPEAPSGGPGHQATDIPVNTQPAGIRLALHHYGEDDLAERARRLTADEHARICGVAGHKVFDDGVLLLDKAVALAAVEVLEGAGRPLARRRRRPLDSRPPD